MRESARQFILNEIAEQEKHRQDNTGILYKYDEIFPTLETDLLQNFCRIMDKLKGRCIVCNDEHHMFEQLGSYLEERNLSSVFSSEDSIISKLKNYKLKTNSSSAQFKDLSAAVSSCEYLIAQTGSIVVSSNTISGRKLNAYPPIQIIVSYANQLVPGLQDALDLLQDQYGKDLPSAITIITGPSRTADIEKTLVLGAHGPVELIIFVSKE